MIPSKHGIATFYIVAVFIVIAAVLVIIFVRANGYESLSQLKYEDAQSKIPVKTGCNPTIKTISLTGTLYLRNTPDQIFPPKYSVKIIDASVSDIRQLGIITDKVDADICLYDVINGGKKLVCKGFSEISTGKGQYSETPYELRYNLPDNDCDGTVDDHTLNMEVTIMEEARSVKRIEKTVGMVGGNPIFQNARW